MSQQRTIQIAGKTYPVKFTLRSVKVYEEKTGRPLLKENYMNIITCALGVDCLTAFVYSALLGALEKNQQLEVTVEDLEQELGLDYDRYENVVQAYIDFVPGLRQIYNRIKSDNTFAQKLLQAGNDEEKLRTLYTELLGDQSPNVTTPLAEG